MRTESNALEWVITNLHRLGSMVLLTIVLVMLAGSQGAAETKGTAQKDSSVAAAPAFADKEFGKLPTYIKSDTLSVLNDQRSFTYQGSVEVRQGDMTLTCDTLDGSYNQQNRIEVLTARGNVTVVKGENIRASGQRAVYNEKSQTIEITESPELQQDQSILTADTIRVYLAENRSVAEGQVRMKLVQKNPGAGAPTIFKLPR